MITHPAHHALTETRLPLAVRAAALVVAGLAVATVFLKFFAAGARIVA